MDKIYKWHIHSTSNEGIWLQKKIKGDQKCQIGNFYGGTFETVHKI